MNSPAEELWRTLRQARVVTGPTPPPASPNPWHTQVLHAVGGWMAAMFLFSFIVATFAVVVRSGGAAMAAGVFCLAGGIYVFRAFRENIAVVQAGLAAGLVGQALLFMGLYTMLNNPGEVEFLLLVGGVEIGLTAIVPSFVHRTITSAAAILALSFALARAGIPGMAQGVAACIYAVVWTTDRLWADAGHIGRPVGYGTCLALLFLTTRAEMLEGILSLDKTVLVSPHVGTGLTVAALVFATLRLLSQQDVEPGSAAGVASLASIGFLAVFSFWAPGIAAALLIMIVGFGNGNRILTVLGILGLLSYLSYYYYSMHETLLVKSLLLAVTGGVLLAVRKLLLIAFPDTAGRRS